MTVTPKFQELLSRVDKDELLIKLLEGQVDEQIAKSAGLRSKSEDPALAATTEQPAASAELTEAETKNVAAQLTPAVLADLKPALQQLIREELTAQATAATKAQEPITKALETVQNDVTAIKATFARLLGEQPAAHQYRASGDPSTVVNKADDQPAPSQPTIADAMTDHVLRVRQGAN